MKKLFFYTLLLLASIATGASAENVIFSDDFQSNSLYSKGWTTEGDDFSYDWQIFTSDDNYVWVGGYPAEAGKVQFLVTKALDLSDYGYAKLTFKYDIDSWDSDAPTGFGVYCRTGNGAWQELFFTEEETDEWTNKTVTVPGGAANCQIGFKYVCDDGGGVYIDDVNVEGMAQVYLTEDGQSDSPSIFDFKNGDNTAALIDAGYLEEGTAILDVANRKLTLNNAKLNKSIFVNDPTPNYEVVIEGENEIDGSLMIVMVIAEQVKISGTGTLTVGGAAYDHGIYSFGMGNANLVIDGPTIEATGKQYGVVVFSFAGSTSLLKIVNGKVTATATDTEDGRPIVASCTFIGSANIELGEGVEVFEPSEAVLKGAGTGFSYFSDAEGNVLRGTIVVGSEGSAIGLVAADADGNLVVKRIENGRVIIENGDGVFSVTGAKIK